MKTILLAGGRSKRVKPVEDKCFVKICGKMLIEWQIEALKKAGFTDLVIVGNHSNVERLRQLKAGVVVEQEEKDGMIWGMMAAKEEVIDEDSILVVSSNDVVEERLWENVKLKMKNEKEKDGFLVGYKVSRYFPGGYLEVSSDGCVKKIVEKPGEGNEPSDLVNLVIHFHRDVGGLYEALGTSPQPPPSATADRWQEGGQDDLYERALQKLFDQEKKYSVLSYDGFWQAIKYPWHLLRLAEFHLEKLSRNISPDAEIAKTAVVNGNVVIESGVKILDHAVINGPAYLGKGSIIGNHTLVRSSSLGERCVVGHATEVARSLLQDEVWMHKNYIGDSVIGSNVSFGSGTVTGNLRLDEGEISVGPPNPFERGDNARINSRRSKLGLITGDNIRVGINTSFMPGVKIGSNTMIAAALSIGEDVEEGKYVKAAGDVRVNVKLIAKRS